jgi:hypothetical protein
MLGDDDDDDGDDDNYLPFKERRSIYRNRYYLLFHTSFSVNAGFEVFKVVVIKSTIFWDLTPYSPVEF